MGTAHIMTRLLFVMQTGSGVIKHQYVLISTSVLTERHATTTPTVPTLRAALNVNVRTDTETWMGSVDSTVMI
ncbi:hypothetical protein DPMN_050301 [Dreissena polymorpha]|uniref:Uncharacterized protein n=1 Tax=Dreissena polymorpha TaxID=45954 RepID=A0A9D4CGX0_DREPO|nr:hypothetical protein DPMN_050301 [Dreissena polymorpha]